MQLLEKAIALATNAHKDQKDRYGKAYILHPLRVMMKMETDIERITAILHDVVEDTNYSLNDLKKEGFSADIVSALECLTKRENEEYFEYIKRAQSNPLSKKVKIADLEDNMDITRIDIIHENDIIRLNRYLRAYRIIKEI